jgi:hypothetical protein
MDPPPDQMTAVDIFDGMMDEEGAASGELGAIGAAS